MTTVNIHPPPNRWSETSFAICDEGTNTVHLESTFQKAVEKAGRLPGFEMTDVLPAMFGMLDKIEREVANLKVLVGGLYPRGGTPL